MKSRLPLSHFHSFLMAFVLLLGFQSLSHAQLTVENNTSCTIYVQASQVDNGSGEACTPCNVSNFTAIAPGGTWIHPGDASCGHYRWLGVRWYTSLTGIIGVSYNPIWDGDCGQSSRGGRCDGSLTHATWDVPSSPGPATVTIQ